MNRAVRLPDFIEVTNIKDLFWNNNSDLYPTCVPTEYIRIDKTRPTFQSPYLGTCVLRGEYNHCVYNGEFYFLTKLRVQDIEKEEYEYQLDYDVMMNFLNRGAEVKGTLIKTNREDILEGCIQTAVPVLADPINKDRVNIPLLEATDKLLIIPKTPDDKTIREFAFKGLKRWPTKASLNEFVNRINTRADIKLLKDKEWLAKTIPGGGWNKWAHHNPLFIFDSLRLSWGNETWKTLVIKRVLTYLTKHVGEFVLTKLSSIQDHFHNGKIVLGRKDNTIGSQIITDYLGVNVDFSNLSDIVPLDYKTGEEMPPEHTPTIDMLLEGGPVDTVHDIQCLLRRTYLPIANKTTSEGCISPPDVGFMDYCYPGKFVGNNTPQKIETVDGKVGYLWYLNKNNLALTEPTEGKLGLSTWTGFWYRWGFFSADYKNIPPIGFLIFQLFKDTNKWNDLEYIGDDTKEIRIITGINSNVIRNSNTINQWSSADKDLLALWGSSEEISKVMLSLDNFNWLSIAPSDKGRTYKYHTGDSWGFKKYFPDISDPGYTAVVSRSNIGTINNPYSSENPNLTLPQWLQTRNTKLFSYSNITKAKLKATVKKGDILTTDLEHGWVSVNAITHHLLPYFVTKTDLETFFGWRGDIKNESYLSKETVDEDIYIQPYRWITTTTPIQDKETVVLYLYEGKFRLGVFNTFKSTIPISDSSDNLVKAVDGKRSRELTFYHIRPIHEKELDIKSNEIISESLKSLILQYTIGSLDSEEPTGKIHYFTENDLDNGQCTFDLVGTDWYVNFHNGTINLLPKKNDVLIPKVALLYRTSINIPEDQTTYKRINQKTYLNYYGQQYRLNDRFSRKNDEGKYTFTYQITRLIPESKYADPEVEYSRLVVDTDTDQIDVITSIPKKEMRAAEKVDSVNYLMMKERLLQQTMNYEQDKYANELLLGDKQLAMARQREDLDYMHKSTSVGLGLTAALTVAGAAAGVATGGLGMVGAAGAVAKGGASMKSSIEFLIRYPTLMKRIDEDERNMLLANTQQLYQRRQNYEHDFKFQTLKLNKMSGSWQKPSVSNREVQEMYNKELGVGNVYLEVYTPSKGQEVQIKHIYDNFGCECISDHFENNPLLIHNGMEPGLYRFSKLQPGGILSSITDTTIRDILRQILENGVKFSGCNIEVDNEPTGRIYVTVPKRKKVVFQTDNIKDWSLLDWDTYKLQTNKKEIIDTLKKLPKHGLTDEEWEKHKDHFKDIDDDKLLDLINQIINGRESGESVVIALPKPQPTNEDVERLNQTINTLRAQITNLEEQIKSNSQICEADKQQLEEEKRAIQTQLTQCQQQHVDLTKEKEGKEGQITVIQGKIDSLTLEKLDLEKQLNECKEQIKRLLAAQQTCDRINTAEIKRLKDELAKCKREKQELETKLKQVTDSWKSTQRERNRIRNDLNTCNTNLANKEAEIEELKNKLTKAEEDSLNTNTVVFGRIQQLNKRLAEKTKQLEDLQKQCADEKTQLENTKKALEAEIHQHKVDKEDLTQQLNNERVRAINEKDEINRLKKELEEAKKPNQEKIDELQEKIDELTLEKASCDERIAAKHRELEQCRTELDLARKDKDKSKEGEKYANVCTELKAVLNEPYTYDIKARENGWNAFLDLIFELAQNLKWEGITDLDQKLMSVKEIRPVLEKLEELKNIPIIDKAIDVVKEKAWPTYLKWLTEGGDLNGGVDGVIAKVNEIKLMETTPTIHAVKSLLDELNWQSYKAKGQLTEQLKTNQDLQFLFHHIYPGTKTLDLYKALYGDPNVAIIRKRFTEEIQCVVGGTGNALETLVNYTKTISHSVSDISKPTAPSPGTPVTPGEPSGGAAGTGDGQPSTDKVDEPAAAPVTKIRLTDTLSVDLNDNLLGRQVRNAIANFNEAVKGTWASSTTPDWLWTIWNYTYKRYLKTDKAPNWKGNENDKNDYYKLAWVHNKIGRFDNKGRYFAIKRYSTPIPHRDMTANVANLWKRRNEMTINETFLNNLKTGKRSIGLELNSVPTGAYVSQYYKIWVRRNTISDLNSLGLLEDFIKLLYIINGNYLSWTSIGKDYTDDYTVFYPTHYTLLDDIEKCKDIEGSTNRFNYHENDNPSANIGWIMPSEPYKTSDNKWVGVDDNKMDDPSYTPSDMYYRFMRWFYEVATGKRAFEHPWKIDGGGAYAFLEALHSIATS